MYYKLNYMKKKHLKLNNHFSNSKIYNILLIINFYFNFFIK